MRNRLVLVFVSNFRLFRNRNIEQRGPDMPWGRLTIKEFILVHFYLQSIRISTFTQLNERMELLVEIRSYRCCY